MLHPNLIENLRHSPNDRSPSAHEGVKWAYPLVPANGLSVSQLPVRHGQPVANLALAKSTIAPNGPAALITGACPTARFWRIIRQWTGFALMAGVGLAVIGGALLIAALAVGALAGAIAALAQALMALATGAVILAFAILLLMAIARSRRSP